MRIVDDEPPLVNATAGLVHVTVAAPRPAAVTQYTFEQHFGGTSKAFVTGAKTGKFKTSKHGRAYAAAYDDVARWWIGGAELRRRRARRATPVDDLDALLAQGGRKGGGR